MVMTLPFEVGVVVRDLALMERFYCDAIGCLPEHRSRVPETVGGPPGPPPASGTRERCSGRQPIASQ